MEANPNYWLPNAPSIEGITWFQGALQSVGNVEGLLAGDYDVVREVSIEDFGRIRDAGFTLLEEVVNIIYFWNINMNFEPWTNPHARHAFNAGFDRTELNEVAFGGQHTPALWGWLGPTTVHHDGEKFWGYDPEAVRMHLAAGGLEDGFEFDMVVKAEDPLYVDPSLFAQAQLAQFGITMNIVQKPFPDFFAGFFAGEDPGFMGGMAMKADTWQQLSWNLLEGGPHDLILPPDKDPEMQAALQKVAATFESEPRTEAMRDLNRLVESRSYHIKTMHPTFTVAHDPDLDHTWFGDANHHWGLNDVSWKT